MEPIWNHVVKNWVNPNWNPGKRKRGPKPAVHILVVRNFDPYPSISIQTNLQTGVTSARAARLRLAQATGPQSRQCLAVCAGGLGRGKGLELLTDEIHFARLETMGMCFLCLTCPRSLFDLVAAGVFS